MHKAVSLFVFAIVCCTPNLYAQDGYFANWFARVDKTKDEQPHWVTPLATTTPRLEEEYRYDQVWQTNGKGITTDGMKQNFVTPGLVMGRFRFLGRVGFTLGGGYQIATTHFHTSNHNAILSIRFPF